MSRPTMWRRAALLSVLVVILAAFGAWAAPVLPATLAPSDTEFEVFPIQRGPKAPEYVDGEVLVRLKSYVSAADAGSKAATAGFESLNASLGVEVVEAAAVSDTADVYRVKLPANMTVEAAVALYRSKPFVQYAEPNYLWFPDGQLLPNDPLFALLLYGMNNTGQESATVRWKHVPLAGADIDAPEAWEVRTDASSVTVCVIDQGISINHPDLAANIWVNAGEIPGNGIDDDHNGYVDDINGWDFAHDDNTVFDPSDGDLHGSHVSGTIGAVGNNEIGVVGVAWKVRIMSCKFLAPGGGDTMNAVKALNYAKANGAAITSNSWGGGGYSEALYEAIKNSNMLFIAAAGNSASDDDLAPHYPSSYDLPNIIAVAATTWDDRMANFSCYGAQSVDIGAPGHMILSTCTVGGADGYYFMGGTSMSTPHVSGAAALLIAEYPYKPQYEGAPGWAQGMETIKDLILNSGDPLPDLVGRTTTGRRLNVGNAIKRIFPVGIEEATADVAMGAAPLKVRFEAKVDDTSVTRDAWWSFGDGSADVHALTVPEHVYALEGVYMATFSATNDAGVISRYPMQITVANPGTIVYVNDTGGFAAVGPLLDASFFRYALGDADKPFVELNAKYPFSIAKATSANPIFWDTSITRFETLSPFEEMELATVLENGGRLFMASPDVIYDLGIDWFGTNYLHVADAIENVELEKWFGIQGDPITDGMELDWQVKTGRDDLIWPDMVSQPILTNDQEGISALRHANDTYRVVYLASPWMSLPTNWAPHEGEEPENPDPNNTTCLLNKVYDYLMGDINIPPAIDKAEANLYFVKPDRTIAFTGIAHDPDAIAPTGARVENGNGLTYEWNFGDGSPVANTAEATHKYAEAGDYWATLKVTDAGGEFVGAELHIFVLHDGGVVLVDDDDGKPNEYYFIDVLDELDVDFAVATPSEAARGRAAASGLEQFRVIWSCGADGWLSGDEEGAVADLLDKGGRLFLNGPEVMWVLDPATSAFSRNYLHVVGKIDDVGTKKVRGVAGDPISDGLLIDLDFGALYDGTDSLTLGPGASPVFLNDAGMPCALRASNGSRLVFFAFLFEAIPSAPPAGTVGAKQVEPTLSQPATILGDVLDWLSYAPSVQVTAPVGGEVWYGPKLIKWTATDPEAEPLSITIQVSFDGGGAWQNIASGEANDGEYLWDTTKLARGGKCTVKVIATDPHGATGQGMSGEITVVVAPLNSFLAGPNPASGSVNFYFNTVGPATLYVYDVAGRIAFSHDVAAGEYFFQWQLIDNAGKPLANGLYLGILVTKDGVKSDTMRLVISR
ncbi:MAG: S8 family serine peptidase [Clostridia bacterium]|nr:S8 family serine peptidase [Clostridia bacterium]